MASLSVLMLILHFYLYFLRSILAFSLLFFHFSLTFSASFSIIFHAGALFGVNVTLPNHARAHVYAIIKLHPNDQISVQVRRTQ